MTPDQPHDEPLTPEQDAQVRRALGSVPPAGRTPEAVADRLDAALAALVADRAAGSTTPAVDLDAARRRRRLRAGLVAAASVAVLGIGLGTVLDDLSVGGASDSATSADGGMAREMAPEAGGGADSGGTAEGGAAGLPPDALLTTTRQDLSSATLARDVRRVAAMAVPPARVQDAPGGDSTADEDDDSEGPATLGEGADARVTLARCVVPPLRPGDQVAPVTLDGSRATLVVRPAEGAGAGTREAQIYACDDGDSVLARTVVPGG